MNVRDFVVFASLVSVSSMAQPFGEVTNCREETTVKKIYGGQISCEAEYTQRSCVPINSREVSIIRTKKFETLTEFVGDTDKSTKYLTKMIKVPDSYAAGPGMCTIPIDINTEISCTANIPYLRDELVRKTVCDYKPVVSIVNGHRSAIGQNLSSGGKDYDGTIVNYLWEVNGQFFSSSPTILLPHSNMQTTSYQVKHTVTDNSGYKTSVEQSVTFINDECSTQACRNR